MRPRIGPPGFGKTFLTSHMIHHLQEDLHRRVAYFFFFSEKEGVISDPSIVFRSWLSQLAATSSKVYKIVRDKRSENVHIPLATRGTVLQLLREALKADTQCYLVIDGLDECTSSSLDTRANKPPSMAEFLRDLISLAGMDASTRVLVVSRATGHIRQTLAHHDAVSSLQIEPEHTMGDCQVLSRSLISNVIPQKNKGKLRDKIIKVMHERCGGQMLWVRATAYTLSELHTLSEYEQVVRDLPMGLEDIYDKIWKHISEKPRALELLRWVVYAVRPMTVEELAGAVLVLDERDEVFATGFPEEECDSDAEEDDETADAIDKEYLGRVLDSCGQFLTVLQPHGSGDKFRLRHCTVHVVHETVRKFLVERLAGQSVWNNGELGPSLGSPQGQDPAGWADKQQHRILARLSLWATQSSRVCDDADPGSRFGKYAAGWYIHIRRGVPLDQDEETMGRILAFMDTESHAWQFWRHAVSPSLFDRYSSGIERLLERYWPAYFALLAGLPLVAERMFPSIETDGSADDGMSRVKLLHFCSREGHMRNTKQLLDAGADVNGYEPYSGTTILISASCGGHVDAVALLLDRGADIDARAKDGSTALENALSEGHFTLSRFLIDRGAGPHSPSIRDEMVVRMAREAPGLLEFLHASKRMGLTKWHLQHAVKISDVEAARYLLRLDANINYVDSYSPTVLHDAAKANASPDMFRLLLSHGAHVMQDADRAHEILSGLVCVRSMDLADNDGWNRWYASMRLLRAHGGDIHARGLLGDTLMVAAARFGTVGIVKYLLDEGVDPLKSDHLGKTPMGMAANKFHVGVVRLLLGRGVEVDPGAVYWAVHARRTSVLDMLIEGGASIAEADKRKPLLVALMIPREIWAPTQVGTLEMAQYILDRGARVDTPDIRGYTPLYHAHSVPEMAKFLFDKGLDVNAPCDTQPGRTGVHCAAEMADPTFLSLLLDHGADVTRRDAEGNTALHLLKDPYRDKKRTTTVLDTLLSHGLQALTDAPNDEGQTPLHVYLSWWRRQHKMARALLKRGADINAVDAEGRTPLDYAGEGYDIDRVTLESLVRQGVDIWRWDKKQRGPSRGRRDSGYLDYPAIFSPFEDSHDDDDDDDI